MAAAKCVDGLAHAYGLIEGMVRVLFTHIADAVHADSSQVGLRGL